ncbi:uncharacterized protein V6R79_014512 [Siganus canaliculatus]
MYRQQFEWAEADSDDSVPWGAVPLGLSAPADGRKYIMYHGTSSSNSLSIKVAGFYQSSDGMLGCGVYLSRDLEKAKRYPLNHPEHERVVIKVVVNVGRVKKIDSQGHPLQCTWHDHGYDTAWVPPNCGMAQS